MQQRRLRLGDIVDDYCPRERRLTNHAVVAMVDDDVKQTRCTTCDAEHEFKHGKMPTLRRKKDSVSAAYKEVLAAVTSEPAIVAPQIVAPREAAPASEPLSALPEAIPPAASTVPALASPAAAEGAPERTEPPVEAGTIEADATGGEAASGTEEAGRVHRRLIRATLPRPENEHVARPIPEFTMHQPQGRGKFRGGSGRGMGSRPGGGRAGHGAHGNAMSRGPVFGRPAGNRAGAGRGDMPRHGRGQQQGRHGKKHSK